MSKKRTDSRPFCDQITKSTGKPCTNRAKQGSTKCGSHGGNSGRPPLTPSVLAVAGEKPQSYGEAICALVRLGMRKGPAAKRMRVHPSTVESWIERGEADLEENKQTEFSEFVTGLMVADSAFITDNLEVIHKAAKGSDEKPGEWRAAMALLERLRKEEFSPKHQIEHSGEVNIVEQHIEQLLEPLQGLLADLGVLDDPRVPVLIEKHFGTVERVVT